MATTVTVSESKFKLKDGLQVYERTWEPTTTPKAHLILFHGFGDHVTRLDKWVEYLLSLYPIRVTGWDRRGWGKTVRNDADKGLTGDNKQMFADVHEYLNHILASQQPASLPVFLTGHSMGAQEILYYLLANNSPYQKTPQKIAGVVLSAPYVALHTPLPSIAISLGRKAAWLSPNRQLKSPNNSTGICHDQAAIDDFVNDPLCHQTGTLRGIVAAVDRELELTELSDAKKTSKTLKTKLPVPVQWGHGTDDGACNFQISKNLFERLEACGSHDDDKVFHGYEGWFHQLDAEPGESKEIYARNVGEWIIKVAERSV